MIKSPITTSTEYQGLPLLEFKNNMGYYNQVLDRINERIESSLNRTSQCLVVRLVVNFPVDINATSDNSCFQYFIEEYRRYLGGKLLHYLWVREQHYSHNQHYHVILFIDGNKIRYFRCPSKAEDLWSNAINKFHNINFTGTGLIHQCSAYLNNIPMNHGMLIQRGDVPIMHEVFRLCSYLAKVATKGDAPKGVRSYGSSQLN